MYVEEIVVVVVELTAKVGTVNAAEVAPVDTVILDGVGFDTPVLVLLTGTVTDAGAAMVNATEQFGTVSPPTTSTILAKPLSRIADSSGLTVIVAVLLMLPSFAVIVAVPAVVTMPVLTVNVAVVDPWGTVTDDTAGEAMLVALLLKLMTEPPAGAAL